MSNLKTMPQEVRYKILLAVLNKGAKPKDLGITPAYKYMLLKRRNQ